MKSTWETHVESYIPLIILNRSIISPRYRLYFSVGKCKIFNRFVYGLFDNSGINLVAHWPSFVLAPICQHLFSSLDTIRCWNILNEI